MQCHDGVQRAGIILEHRLVIATIYLQLLHVAVVFEVEWNQASNLRKAKWSKYASLQRHAFLPSFLSPPKQSTLDVSRRCQ